MLEAIAELEPDLAISVFFGFLLKDPFLRLFRGNAINLHPGYLPYNRGRMPNVWSIVDQTPAGATLHYIDAGVDTGDIIAQKRVVVEPIDTGESLYSKLEDACVDLFRGTWPLIKAGKARRTAQPADEGTHHRGRDVELIDAIDLGRMYMARDLLNVLRARTFPPFPGAHFEIDGKQVYVRVELSYGPDLPPRPDEVP
jgi:methionyl-tRNA formyltransferase